MAWSKWIGLPLAALVITPASSAVIQPGTADTSQEEVDFDANLNAYYQALGEKKWAQAKKLAAALTSAGNGSPVIGSFGKWLRSVTEAGQGRNAAAEALLTAQPNTDPAPPELQQAALPAFLIIGREDLAARLLDRLVSRGPDMVRKLPPEWVMPIVRWREGPRTERENRMIALSEIGYLGERGDWIANEAIGYLLARGDTARAISLLRFIDEPASVEDMLVIRRYESLWPAIAAQAGPGLAKSRESSVRAAEAARAEDSDNSERLVELVSAYRQARRLDDALALRNVLPADTAAMARIDEHTGWAINELALALYDAGRGDEGDALFAALNNGVPANPWRVGMFINRVEKLVQAGKFADALPLIAVAEKEPKNAYAEQLLRRLRYCATARTGQAAEAAKLRSAMMAHVKDAPAPTIEGLLCTGEVDEAEKIALSKLNDELFQDQFVRNLQKVPLSAGDASVWGGWGLLRARPAMATAFARLGRDLPADYLPPKFAKESPAVR